MGALSSVGSYAQQAWDFAQNNPQVIQAAQQFAGAIGLDAPRPVSGPPAAPAPSAGGAGQPAAGDGGIAATAPTAPSAQPAAAGAPRAADPIAASQPYGTVPLSAAGGDQFARLLQALAHRQIPPLPGPVPPPGAAPMPAPAAAPGQPDAFGLLRIILTNPQLQQALQSPPGATGVAVPRTVSLPVPAPTAPRQIRSVNMPMGAVLNALLAIIGQSMTELNEGISEDEPEIPEYLVAENGEFVVDPASGDDRAALVAHLFRLNDAARRSGRYPQLNSRSRKAGRQLDDGDEWARAAGFL